MIARVHGIATAAGCQLVAMCDLAVASDDARFAVSGVNFGLFCSTPERGAVAQPRRARRPSRCCVTGDFISADEAREKGLVNRVAAPEALDDEIEALVASIVAKPRVAVALGKQLFYRQLEAGIEPPTTTRPDDGLQHDGPSALEGVQAFIEKRPPGWAATVC